MSSKQDRIIIKNLLETKKEFTGARPVKIYSARSLSSFAAKLVVS